MARSKSWLLAAAAALLLPGCVIYDEDAELRIYWQFSRAAGCLDAHVSDVLVEVDGGDDFYSSGFAPCELGYLDIPEDFEKGDVVVRVFGFPPLAPGEPDPGPTWYAEALLDLHGGFNEYTFVLDPI